MNEYAVVVENVDYIYPETITFALEAESFADAEAKALEVYDINCNIISITRVQGSN